MMRTTRSDLHSTIFIFSRACLCMFLHVSSLTTIEVQPFTTVQTKCMPRAVWVRGRLRELVICRRPSRSWIHDCQGSQGKEAGHVLHSSHELRSVPSQGDAHAKVVRL